MNDTVTDRVQEAVGSLASDTKTKIDEIARQATCAAEDTYGRVNDQVRDGAEAVSDSVKRHPLVALLVAGTVGCALGLLLPTRRGPRHE